MQFFRAFKSTFAQIACLAILLNAIAPTLSHAFAADQTEQTSWMQVCTVAGIKLIPLSINDPPTESSTQPSSSNNMVMSMEHCAYCFNHAGTWALLTSTETKISIPDLSYQLPPLFYHSPRPLFAWASSNPRAPPALA